jgi:hypothetical protein
MTLNKTEIQLRITFSEEEINYIKELVNSGKDRYGILSHIVEEYLRVRQVLPT